jgi:hypothetical protein
VALAKLRVFLTVNLPLLVVCGIFDYRALLIGLFALMPNVCGNIGGAEKTGWATHYHAMYFPVYVWAAASGYAALVGRARSALRRAGAFALVALLALFYLVVDPYQAMPAWRSWSLRTDDVAWVVAYRNFRDIFDPIGYNAYIMNRTRGLREAVPAGASVSCPEGYMPALYHGHQVDLYPAGVDNDDVVIMDVDRAQSGLHRYSAMASFLSAAENRRIDDVILARMAAQGFDLEHPIRIETLAVFKRVRPR